MKEEYMKKHIKVLSIFLGIGVICIGAISVYRFSSHQPLQQNAQEDKIKIFKVERLHNLVKDNDIIADDYNHKTIYLKGRVYSVRDRKEYYELKLAPLKGEFFSITRFKTIPCKFSMEQKKNLERLKKDKVLVIKGNISIDKRLFNRIKLEMNDCIIVDESKLRKGWFSGKMFHTKN